MPNEEGKRRLESMIDKIREEGKKNEYDCLMGISGGLDSSYLAYLGSQWGLRILGVHIDDGFDTRISKDNIQKLCKAANIKLIIVQPDSEQFNDLTRAFILAGVPNIAIPQDNILFAYLYKLAKENGIHYFLSGGNFALESILQKGNTYTAFDTTHIMAINKKFGTTPIDKLPLLSQFQRGLDKYIYKINTFRPLNLINYNRKRAINELKEFCGFTYYGGKHLENTLTKFIQLYYLPKKFGVDKRKSHLSSLIVSGQITRQEALEELKQPLYDEEQMEKEIRYLLKCLNINTVEFEAIMRQPPKQHNEYRTSTLCKAMMFLRKFKKD